MPTILRYWNIEKLKYWHITIFRQWNIEILKDWDIELLRGLKYWDIGILIDWNIEILKFWKILVYKYFRQCIMHICMILVSMLVSWLASLTWAWHSSAPACSSFISQLEWLNVAYKVWADFTNLIWDLDYTLYKAVYVHTKWYN